MNSTKLTTVSGILEIVRRKTVLTMSHRILLIDDNEELASTYELLLNEEGFAGTSVTTIASAIAYLNDRGMPSLILLDCSMPGQSVEKFLQDFKQIPDRCTVIGFSSYAKGSGAIAHFESEVDAYIEKPDEINVFIDTIGKFLPPK